MESTQRMRKPRPSARFVYIDAGAFPKLETDEPGVITIGAEPADVGQQPWPTEPTLWDIQQQYIREHVVPDRCDLARTVCCQFMSHRVWDVNRPAKSFNRADSRDFIQMRREDGVKDATIKRELTIIGAAFGHAAREERIPKRPKFIMPKGGEPRMRFLTVEEHRSLMLRPMPYWRRIFWLIAFETGVRSQAILELTWDRVDLVNRQIDFRIPGRNHKNKRRPIAPINSRLYPRLVAAKARHDASTAKDLRVVGVSACWAGCKADMVAIGINERGICRHVARHTFCSWRVQAGFSYAHIGKLVGDTSAMVERVYGHLSPKHLIAASELDVSALRIAA